MDFLMEYKQLNILDLYDNRIKELHPESLAALQQLTSLDLSFNLIDDIGPLNLLSDTIENLYLVSNNIKKIPLTALNHLKKLKLLELGANKLSVDMH
jgi:Leucine-rich repeat (LRR) protein